MLKWPGELILDGKAWLYTPQYNFTEQH